VERTPSWGEYGVLLPLVETERQTYGGIFDENYEPRWLKLSSAVLSLASPKSIASRDSFDEEHAP